jgi:hypothetical protein
MVAQWLADAVVYEVYPQSFADSDGDGVGDLRGVIDRLDHIASLGVDALWFNPCFESPFVDAGYDVSDYLRVAPRYGTNDDLVELVARPGNVASASSSTWPPATPRSSTPGSGPSWRPTARTRRVTATSGATSCRPRAGPWTSRVPPRGSRLRGPARGGT